MWKVTENPSNPAIEECRICHTTYPDCTTCRKYGRTRHQNYIYFPLHSKKQCVVVHSSDASVDSNDNLKDKHLGISTPKSSLFGRVCTRVGFNIIGEKCRDMSHPNISITAFLGINFIW